MLHFVLTESLQRWEGAEGKLGKAVTQGLGPPCRRARLMSLSSLGRARQLSMNEATNTEGDLAWYPDHCLPNPNILHMVLIKPASIWSHRAARGSPDFKYCPPSPLKGSLSGKVGGAREKAATLFLQACERPHCTIPNLFLLSGVYRVPPAAPPIPCTLSRIRSSEPARSVQWHVVSAGTWGAGCTHKLDTC